MDIQNAEYRLNKDSTHESKSAQSKDGDKVCVSTALAQLVMHEM
jgi:hypothetical protein